MNSVKLLDCTLRDGGYVNDWSFGYETIASMIAGIECSGVDILEMGFLKNEPYDVDRTVYNAMSQIKNMLKAKKSNIEYAAMIEVVNPLPLDLLEPRDKDSVDIIRVIVWKRLLQEGFEYCKGVVEKGYKLCVQPARVDQYSDREFIDMVNMFNQINPYAVYVVDSWGTQYTNSILNYINLADRYLNPGISVGYHGHNNLMQAFATSEAFLHMKTSRDKIVDASVYGIGRGAGNLNIELIAKYMNEVFHKKYNIIPLINIYEKHIKEIQDKFTWGYSIPYYLTALNHCNPNYASYYGDDLGLSASLISELLSSLSDEDKIIFSEEKARRHYERVRGDVI